MKEQLTSSNLRIEYNSSINYASTLIGTRYLNICELTNDEEEDWHDLVVSISGEMLIPTESRISMIPKGQTVSVSSLDIKPDLDTLRHLTESVDTQFVITVKKFGNEEVIAPESETGEHSQAEKGLAHELYRQSEPIHLMAYDQWPGIETNPELLSVFVTPNTPALAPVKLATAKQLERLTGASALDDYQTKDPNRARAQVAAVYEAFREQGLVYITPPPSFEKEGQRVRLTDKVLTQKQGTCLDLSLAYASCLESIGLHPLVIIAKGHAYVGCWLVDKYYPQTFCDDVSFLSKSVADGISEMVVVEATMLTEKGVSFEQAVKMAEDHLHLKADDFIMAVDVFRCRLLNVRPLPTSDTGTSIEEGLELDQATDGMRELHQYDLENSAERHLTRQQIWERKLLDFSLRNNLLNMRIGKKLTQFVSFDIDVLEDHLQAKEDFKIIPRPSQFDAKADENGIYDSRALHEAMGNAVSEGLKHKQLYSYLKEEELTNTLKNLFRSSRTALEENGANTLFLVLGIMKWYETDKSVKPRYAPLLLEPVDLVKKSGNNYVLRVRDEDITFNTTLMEMMSQQFDIHLTGLDPIPTDESGIDVRKVFATVRKALETQQRWDVIEESMLGLFSFSKFVMWNDIHNNADKMRQNPVVESLIQKRLVGVEEPSTTDTRKVDVTVTPGSYAIPVDVDSSQLEAVIESGEGRSFILYGPPGTGKSQTITNMIANALFHNRRVLFVAEKMAALEVVQKRLAKIGLDPFCLEMHSNKMTKSHLLQQLQSALDLTRIKSPEAYENESNALFEQRKSLIKYVNLLHEKQSTGLSLYDYITRYTSIEGKDALPPTSAFLDGIDSQRIDEVEKAILQLTAVLNITGSPKDHPLSGLSITDPSYDALQKATTFLQQVGKLAPNVRTALRALAQANGLTLSEDITSVPWAVRFADALAAIPSISGDLLRIVGDEQQKSVWQQHIADGKTLKEVRATITKDYAKEVLSLDVIHLRGEWANACDKWFLPRYFAKKKVVKSLRGYRPNVSSDDIEPLLALLDKHKVQQEKLSSLRQQSAKVFGAIGTPEQEQWDMMEESLRQAPAILAMLGETSMPAAYVPPVNANATQSLDLTAIRQMNDLMSAAHDYCTIDPRITIDDVILRTPQWLVGMNKSRDWAQWCIRRRQMQDQGLAPTIEYIESGHSSDEACAATLRGLYKKLSMDFIDHNADLQIFNGIIFEEAIARYRNMAKQFQDLTKKALYCKLASRIPSLTIEAASSSEIGILKRFIASGGRGATIRHIIDQIPTLLPKLCPCMLMSPISVAQFIDLDQEKFDIVVFDEASQMPTSEAIGAIARGKALIVVGDPKQMPPTSFFTTTAVDESEAENDDMESILDDCITLSFPDHYLTWHYRSRHESLIAFSNSQYYDGKLYTFPSVDDRASKVNFVPVSGTYDYGKSRSNRSEAEAIVSEVVRRLKDNDLSKRSIGIVSFSKVQQDLIEDILVDELSKDPLLEKRAYDCEEPIFVKNLENVQGDERDVILFSVGYGPDKNGRVSMNFGPLNNTGGERRLNVAVSRARYEMVVFSTLQPEQIDLNRSRARGVEGLKRFLEFAKSGRMPLSATQVQTETDTALVDAIANELRMHGYQVDTFVGRSRFKVDLAVISPDHPDQYILGIICDGNNYYNTHTQRDREICQPGVLQGLGWNLMRVWTIDWFLNPEKVTDRILDLLDSIKSKNAPEANKGTNAPSSTTIPKSGFVSNMGFTVNENELLEAPENDKEIPYKKADIPQRYTNKTQEVLALARRQVEQDIKDIIATEQPVTIGYLRKRIMDIYGQTRNTERLQHILEKGLSKAYVDPLSIPTNAAYWANAEAAKGYDKYRQASGRDIDDIPLIEVKNAVLLAMSQQMSLSVDDLLSQISRLLGFARRTPKTKDAISRVIEYLEREGKVRCEGDNIILKDPIIH
ncbi:MAG: DUF4011 domain-containing protein [Prevotella sp.]|nr:DUF4011 domain-containing protein [Prevotella sp.]